ncbi:MAG: rod shape-determining protein RodA [Bacteroidota bacterium]|nr:rod shape-determining protein RodA [Bacteroidota bacterium]
MNRREGTFANIDSITIIVYFALVIIGWFSIYSSEYNDSMDKLINFRMSHGKQLINIAVALVIGLFVLLLDFRLYHTMSFFGYVIAIILLVVTIFVGKTVAGAKGWLVIGGFQLQTAEIAKFASALLLARHISRYTFTMKNFSDRIICFGIILLPFVLVLLQNDTGSALVFLSLVLVMYRFGLPGQYLVLPIWFGVVGLSVLLAGQNTVLIGISSIAAIFILLFRRQRKLLLVGLAAWVLTAGVIFAVDFAFYEVLKPYQQERINVTIGQEIDKRGAGYNVYQSLIAIGSGGLSGKGYLNGTQTKLNFVPEQTTDFIFCTVGEEFGWIGSFVLISLYCVLFLRIIRIAERQNFTFNKAYAYGVLSIFFIHFVINLSMTMGLFPVIGIPLPFLSYGGSSLIGFTVLLFILLKLDSANREF